MFEWGNKLLGNISVKLGGQLQKKKSTTIAL